jgi:hypothetical protein
LSQYGHGLIERQGLAGASLPSLRCRDQFGHIPDHLVASLSLPDGTLQDLPSPVSRPAAGGFDLGFAEAGPFGEGAWAAAGVGAQMPDAGS